MKSPELKEVDGKQYKVSHMGPKDQIRTLRYIAQTVGKPIGLIAAEGPESLKGSDAGIMGMDSKIIGLFVESVLTSLDDDVMIQQIEKLLKFCEVDSQGNGKFMSHGMESPHWHGELPHMFKVVGAILEVNFGSFLGVSTELVAKLKSRVQTETPTQQSSAPLQ